ncbi:UNVERIFIED_CONTAM: hypothetical protein Slati_3079300 [Sesamum latifolium]|uniref:Uncharacterized protein n=1 Tax=Sesamum latifolium TaxID=2727402 RepID=A0AAW2UTM9_9LAMI
MSTRSLMTSRRRWPRWHFPSGYGFNACKEQFLTHRPPPAGEELSFLDVQITYANAPNPFANPSALEKEDPPQDSGRSVCLVDDLDSLLGVVEAEVRRSPPVAATDSIEGGVPSEGNQKGRRRRLPLTLQKALSMILLLQRRARGHSSFLLGPKDPKTPYVGKKFDAVAIIFPPS